MSGPGAPRARHRCCAATPRPVTAPSLGPRAPGRSQDRGQHRLEALAIQKRKAAGESAAFWATRERAEADGLFAAAQRSREAEYPDLRLGCGSKAAPRVPLDAPARLRDVADTVRQSPDMLPADASLQRRR